MSDIKAWESEINSLINSALEKNLPNHKFKEVITYSVLPAGKLFRPLLTYSLANDLGGITVSHKDLAVSLELHHAYTLIHDDLPAMDDDDMRRGRPSTHKKFSEWEAILAGDALISLSFELLANIENEKLPEILKLYTQNVGAKGLIMGQVLDLELQNNTIEEILNIHELKTSRLIQTSLSASNILAKKPVDKEKIELIGKLLGINFQLLDDLCELTQDLSQHEKDINPFLRFDHNDLIFILMENSRELRSLTTELELNSLKGFINIYISKISHILSDDLENINKYESLEINQIKNLAL